MKKALLTTLAIVIIAVLAGCGGTDSGGEQTVFKGENKLPNLMAVSDGTYYIMTCKYGNDQYQLSVSEKMNKLKSVYDVEGASIWYLCAEGDFAVWVEAYDDRYDYKLYNRENDKTISFNSVGRTENESQNMQTGIYNGTIYYSEIDYAENKISVKRYNIREEKTETIHEETLPEDATAALDVNGEILTAYLGGNQLYCLNLESGEEKAVEIPEKMDGVYAVSYDQGNDMYALYYSAKGSGTEDIGTFTPGNKQIKSLYTLSENCYAYRDNIEIDNGHLFWVTQVNTSGDVVDHYTLVDYSCLDDGVEEYPSTFGFALTDDTLFALSFAGNIDKVDIEKIDR